ncbi:2,4-dienoyl-CoA reductase-like NADH-dependent reductase (Old Yellow Enzyme family) [Massilia sp. UYP11]|jgi:hypothetical protein|uniref:hypothetical protein n=1 Tax=Massilia sp. UYP11 TaxID=1756385 RepID=UPI003D233265
MAKELQMTTLGLMTHSAHAAAQCLMNDMPITVAPSSSKSPTVAPAPRELTDVEVQSMWAKHPGVSFSDFL